jgi:hypothetical protein
MLELIALGVTGATTAVGYIQSRRFVRDRLRFVEAVQASAAPVVVGAAAAIAAAPVAWVLPLVGAGTAVLFGVGVGAGVAAGRRDIRRRLPSGL